MRPRTQIQDLIHRHGQIFIKPLFKGGDRQEGQGRPDRPRDRPGRTRWPRRSASTSPSTGTATSVAKANGVTFEGGVPAEHEVYFSITDDTRFRAPTITLTHKGGIDIEELDKARRRARCRSTR